MPRERKPLIFFLNGAIALAVLFGVTFTMATRPEVEAVRAMILVGLGIIALKVVLRHYDIDFPPRRERRINTTSRPNQK
jgi:hypothetical protein